MTLTRKFSEFVAGQVEAVVGLSNGANTIGPTASSGGAVTETFPQSSPLVSVGQWLRVQPITGQYVLAQGDSAEDGEVVGIVIVSTPTTFTLQQSGYISSAQNVVSGLVAGDVQFLDTATPGAMVPTDASVNGQISRPVFLPDSPTSGWVLPYRPLIVGGAAPEPVPGPGTDTNLVVVNQTDHRFVPGDVLYVNTAPNSGGVSYALALATNFNTSQAVGIVVANPAPTTNQFTLQFAGYNVGSLLFDNNGNPVIPNTVYYLSDMDPGQVTSVAPTNPGSFTKPIYISEQGTGNTGGIQAGYILPQRPLGTEENPVDNPNVVLVNQAGHGFLNTGTWVYVSGSSALIPQQYSPAIANALNSSQVAGVIINIPNPNSFYLQTEGYNVGAIYQDYMADALVPATTYYLSDSAPGAMQSFPPVAIGSYTKPLFNCEQTAAVSGINAGYIWGQRPLPILLTPEGNDTSLLEVTQVDHGFTPGQYVYIQADDTYALANPNALPSSQAIGVVRERIDANHFVVQQTGNIQGVVTHDDLGAPIVSGVTYYLSPRMPGQITSVPPAAVGQYIVPVYIQQDQGTSLGWVLPAVPEAFMPAPEPPGNGAIIQVRYTNFLGSANYYVGTPYVFTQLVELNTNITLNSAANSVKVTFSITYQSSGGAGIPLFAITRNGTVIPAAVNSVAPAGPPFYNSATAIGPTNSPGAFGNTTFTFIDTPGGTGPYTYGVTVMSSQGTGIQYGFYLNGIATLGNNNIYGISTMVLEEIA